MKSLSEKIAAIKSKLNIKKSNDEDQHLFEDISQFLTISEHKINCLQTVTEHDMEKLRKKVADFFCEDVAQFKLEQCFQIFIAFVQRFKIAIEENRKRNENQQKVRARQQKQQCTENSYTSLIESGPSLHHNDRIMFRSHDVNMVSDTTKFCSSMKRSSRPCSQDFSNVDSAAKQDLVEFLKSAAHNDRECTGTNIDGNLFGTQFRRIGSGRRSLRGTNNSNEYSDNERERVIIQSKEDSESLIDSTSTTVSAFNRFSPLRRTIKNQSKEDPSDSSLNSSVDMKSQQPPKITIEECSTNYNQKRESIKSSSNLKETVNSKPNRNFLFEFKKKPLLNQYIQQLTAIISPSKYVENTDSIHKEFENQSKNSRISNQSPVESANIIISTVAKERPSSMKLPSSSMSDVSFEQRRSFSLTSRSSRMTESFINKSNHAIVVPVQKMEKNTNEFSLPHQSISINLNHKSPSPSSKSMMKSLTKEIGLYADD